MSITIDLNAAAIVILVILAIVIGVYIIMTLTKFNRTLDNINSLLDDSRKDIDSTIKSLPPILGNVNDITTSIKTKTDVLDNYFDPHKEVAAAMDFDTIASGISTIINLIIQARSSFGGKKRIFRKK